MKTKLITLLTIVLFLHSDLFGQVTGNQRGLYVNQFVELFHNLNPGGPNNSINTAYSILGNTTAENRLLTYCMENHITYIALYDMANIFDGSSQQANKIIALKNFICKAKSNYCIKYVGASVKLDTYLPIKNGFALRQTPPFIFDTTFHGTELYDSLRYLEDTIPSDDARFAVAEMLKLSLRIAFLNNSSISSVAWTQCPQENVDILLTECINRSN